MNKKLISIIATIFIIATMNNIFANETSQKKYLIVIDKFLLSRDKTENSNLAFLEKFNTYLKNYNLSKATNKTKEFISDLKFVINTEITKENELLNKNIIKATTSSYKKVDTKTRAS